MKSFIIDDYGREKEFLETKKVILWNADYKTFLGADHMLDKFIPDRSNLI